MKNKKVAYWSVTVAVAGFLFGFDVAVISGADQPLQALWKSSDLFHGGFIMSSALWGTVLGALLGNIPCEKYGRKPTLIATGVLFLLSALGSALAPANIRGRLVALYQFQIVFGILVAYLSNYSLSESFGLDWRWMLGIEAVPALIFILMVMGIPESPRWLILRRNDEALARQILGYADEEQVDRVVAEIRHAQPRKFSRGFVPARAPQL